MNRPVFLFAVAASALFACTSPEATSPQVAAESAGAAAEFVPRKFAVGKPVNTDTGLTVIQRSTGIGSLAVPGNPVTVHYTGWLFDKDQPQNKGSKFDSSRDRDEPFRFTLGAGDVIPGWDEGVAGMKVGGVRTLLIPPHLAYGPRGYPPVIPPSATLIFEIQLLGVEK